MAKLADALDLGSSEQSWRFKSSQPHQKIKYNFYGEGMNYIGLIIGLSVVGVVVIITVCVYTAYANKKRLREIIEEFNLTEGDTYEVTQNGGRTIKGLVFQEIYYGKRSANGNINLRFIKQTTYRGETSSKEVIIKYGSIWKIKKAS